MPGAAECFGEAAAEQLAEALVEMLGACVADLALILLQASSLPLPRVAPCLAEPGREAARLPSATCH